MKLPPALDELIDYAYPDSLWVAGQQHSDGFYTVWVLDVDSCYNELRASLSLDQRWTLTPVQYWSDRDETVRRPRQWTKKQREYLKRKSQQSPTTRTDTET